MRAFIGSVVREGDLHELTSLGLRHIEAMVNDAGVPPGCRWGIVTAVEPLNAGTAEIGFVTGPDTTAIELATVSISGTRLMDFDGFCFELMGQLLEDLPNERRWPAAWFGDVAIQIRLERAWLVGSPLTAERTWGPDGQARPAIRGWDRKHTDADIAMAKRGLRLLELVSERPNTGRPKGATYYAPSWFVGELLPAYQRALEHRWPKPVRQLDVAAMMLMPFPTWRRYFQAYWTGPGKPWPPC